LSANTFILDAEKCESHPRQAEGWPLLSLSRDYQKLICLRNSSNTSVFNGEQFLVLGVGETDHLENRIDLVLQSLNLPERPILTVRVATECFANPPSVAGSKRRGVNFFDYAYGITVHKAQGGEWDRAQIIDEPALKAPDRRLRISTAFATRPRQYRCERNRWDNF